MRETKWFVKTSEASKRYAHTDVKRIFHQLLRYRNQGLVALCLCLAACTSTRPITKQNVKTLHQLVAESPVFSNSFTGFMLYDPATGHILYSQHADKYFTPASNTKIFTLYTATQFLGDSLPLLNYQLKADSLFFWGTGNPSFLHHHLPQDDRALSFLKQHQGPLIYSDHNFRDKHFGPGWAWDDYTYAFQTEKSSLPLFGNVVLFSRDSTDTSPSMEVSPSYFKQAIAPDPSFYEAAPYFRREASHNHFTHNQLALSATEYQIEKPFITSPELVARLLADTLKRPVEWRTLRDVEILDKLSLQVPFPDTIYQLLMKESDNFTAEQLLLMCSDRKLGFLQTDTLIQLAKKELYADAPDELLWYDGSGLTRYNMFTPRTVVHVLQKLWKTFPEHWLFSIFPGGGEAGTISEWYGNGKEAYVYAKTGTLRNKHCLGGYLLTDSGKTLIFSFMHNNFPTGSSPLKEEMEKVLLWIKQSL